MKIINKDISLILEFPKDKMSKEERGTLASRVSDILHVNTLVVDMDCNILVINHNEDCKEDNK